MPISATNPFKGRQYPGEVILQAVRWYLRYPLAYEHVAEILAERGIEVDASCIWRWVQAYSPELSSQQNLLSHESVEKDTRKRHDTAISS